MVRSHRTMCRMDGVVVRMALSISGTNQEERKVRKRFMDPDPCERERRRLSIVKKISCAPFPAQPSPATSNTGSGPGH